MIEARHTDKTTLMPLVRKSDDHTYKQTSSEAVCFIFGMTKAVHTSVKPQSSAVAVYSCMSSRDLNRIRKYLKYQFFAA